MAERYKGTDGDSAHQGSVAEGPSRSGVVVERTSELPLAGVKVRWTVNKPGRRKGQDFGSAWSDRDGRFTIRLADDSGAKDAYHRLVSDRNGTSWLVADNAEGLVEASAEGATLVIAPGSMRPVKKNWRQLSQFMMTNRLLQVGNLIAEVQAPSPGSPAAHWTVPIRARVLSDLHRSLPELKGEGSLAGNRMLAFGNLEKGSIGRAISGTVGVEVGGRSGAWFVPLSPKADLVLYRDYLRSVWVAAASKMYREEWLQGSLPSGAPATLEAQLDRRFHQDFHTPDVLPQRAAKLLIPLLTSTLTAGPNREGFDLLAASIPPQGAQSDEQYLDALIALTKVSKPELRNRFRVSFERKPVEDASPVGLNVEALLGLLSDTFQSPQEPFPIDPPLAKGKPLVFGREDGHAPFFLEYEEWLERNRAFFPENAFDIRRTIPLFEELFRQGMKGEQSTKFVSYPQGYFDNDANERSRSGVWVCSLFAIVDALREALLIADTQNYPDALAKLANVDDLLVKANKAYDHGKWQHDRFIWAWSWTEAQWVDLFHRAKVPVGDLRQLDAFEKFFEPHDYPEWTGQATSNYSELAEESAAWARTKLIYLVYYLRHVVLPYERARIAFATGDYAGTLRAISPLTGYTVGVAETGDDTPYDEHNQPASPDLYRQANLPYTTSISFDKELDYVPAKPGFYGDWWAVDDDSRRLAIAPFEQRFFKLFQGEVMLALADGLYRTDEPASIRRARELYKGVLFMHGEDPEIAPQFPKNRRRPHILDPLWRFTQNPAMVSQIARSRLALFHIEQGLNAYGYSDDLAPLLRYRPLKQAADAFAASAKSAQIDYLVYLTRLEQAQIELWQSQAMVKKAVASSQIATEQIALAQSGVDKAKEQVAALNARIAAKEAEIADADSFFAQAKDYFSGVKDSLEGLVPLAQKVIAEEGAPAAAGGSVSAEDLAGIVSKGFSGGASASEDAATSALGPGAGFLVGYGVFVYASYQTLQGMSEAANSRSADLKALKEVARPAAEAQVQLRQREVTIAELQRTIAQADLEYGQQLLRFQRDRFLSSEMWNRLALFANRLMRRYVDLGARIAWFAERALAFEQARTIEIIRLDYWPAMLRGLTGADRLQADLADLEASRLQGIRLTVPVKHTISLAREFPIAFGQLKKTGRCEFRTDDVTLRLAYPGTFGYRIRALTVAGHDPESPPPRGILRNHGISSISAEDGSMSTLVRFPDALPLSEFRLHDDLFVYGLPGETLLQFESSGFSTDWELELPLAANLHGLRTVADVLISFDMNASYSSNRRSVPLTAGTRAIMLAASAWDPRGLASLRSSTGPGRITFDPRRVALPLQEKTRKVTNLAIICVGTTRKSYTATLTASTAQKKVAVVIEDGLAVANGGPLLGTAAPSPLNKLAGVNVSQPFELELDKTGVAGVELRRLLDVVLYVEYEATV